MPAVVKPRVRPIGLQQSAKDRSKFRKPYRLTTDSKRIQEALKHPDNSKGVVIVTNPRLTAILEAYQRLCLYHLFVRLRGTNNQTPGVHPDYIVNAGRSICSAHESRLQELETILAPFEKDPLRGLRGQDPSRRSDMLKAADRAVEEYRDLLLKIILKQAGAVASKSGSRPTTFTIKSTPIANVNACTFVEPAATARPFTKRVRYSNSRFSVDQVASNAPSMVLHLPPRCLTYVPPCDLPESRECLLVYEVASQIAHQRSLKKTMTSYQGLSFDGLNALFMFINVAAHISPFKDHGSTIAKCSYFLPSERNVFVKGMADLLLTHEEYRNAYDYVHFSYEYIHWAKSLVERRVNGSPP